MDRYPQDPSLSSSDLSHRDPARSGSHGAPAASVGIPANSESSRDNGEVKRPPRRAKVFRDAPERQELTRPDSGTSPPCTREVVAPAVIGRHEDDGVAVPGVGPWSRSSTSPEHAARSAE